MILLLLLIIDHKRQFEHFEDFSSLPKKEFAKIDSLVCDKW